MVINGLFHGTATLNIECSCGFKGSASQNGSSFAITTIEDRMVNKYGRDCIKVSYYAKCPKCETDYLFAETPWMPIIEVEDEQ